ncbi:hypothetical protein AJ78_07649 [Emergomyces pasteurianus Ep9510]|uniref:YTH domain-containing protein n=1 Tax=Emergomyces pasteurianus Ep9510 TaxID=1447872 RepID=A0A1J9P4H1_9EURO|nr:hypothetical protein AJ78_07649 [Emergomyces pasteurianus Ep9510]
MPSPSTARSAADHEQTPTHPAAVGMAPTSSIGRLPFQHAYYPMPPLFTQFSTPFHIPGQPVTQTHDTWNCRRYDATYNYAAMPGILANQAAFSHALLYHTAVHSFPQPTYYGTLSQQGPKWQHFPGETRLYDHQSMSLRPRVHNNSNLEALNYVHIAHEQPQQTISSEPTEVSTTCYTIIDGSVSGNRAGKATQLLGNEAAGYLKPPIFSAKTPTPRGPPRKPKQSGYALWVGNLPSRASIVDLKEHFSQGATEEIESVFLISNSKCAFVNYKAETACVSAVTRFNDSRFQGIKLVCRLRRCVSSEFTNRESLSPPLPAVSGLGENELDELHGELVPNYSAKDRSLPLHTVKHHERYFIVKSLTIEDLEHSRVSGIWATQRHNEAILNHAYETSEDVYLIFSANKSGEYFGYGRMSSPIRTGEPGDTEGNPRKINLTTASEFLIITSTPPTETAPAGSIVDDPARGTIFWEIDRVDDVDMEKADLPGKTEEEGKVDDGQSFGRPFSVEWLCWRRLPFHRTRGLRNPWNANKEVKIARDGTEIEPGVGKRLIKLFDLTA